MKKKQLAVFVSIMQLFTSYCWHMKEYPEMLHTLTVIVKTDDYQIPKKLMHVCHESYEGIKLGARLVRNKKLVVLKWKVVSCKVSGQY